jgi:hypothetical protein
VSQQGTKPTGRDQGFSTEGFPFVGISVQLLALVATQGRVLCHLHLHCRHRGPPPAAAPQQVHLELPGYQVPLAQSHNSPPPEMHVVVSRDEAPMAVARSEVPTYQRANSRCSCGR